MRHIAVTGGTGFIGRHLMAALASQGLAVRALTRRDDTAAVAGVTWVRGDVNDPEALAELLAGCRAVVHCAGLVKARNAAEFHGANAAAVECLAAVAAGLAEPPFFVHLSSLAAREPLLSSYAASKAAGEEALKQASIPWVTLRPPAVYGPGDMEILKLFKSLKYGVGFIPGTKEGRLSIIHVHDLIAAVTALLAVSPDSVAGKVFELGDNREGGYTLAEIYAVAGRVVGREARLFRVPRQLLTAAAQINRAMARLGGRAAMLTPEKVAELVHPDWVARGERLGELTTWVPQIGLEEGLRETLKWYQAEGYL